MDHRDFRGDHRGLVDAHELSEATNFPHHLDAEEDTDAPNVPHCYGGGMSFPLPAGDTGQDL
jgi:hypothetical protein